MPAMPNNNSSAASIATVGQQGMMMQPKLSATTTQRQMPGTQNPFPKNGFQNHPQGHQQHIAAQHLVPNRPNQQPVRPLSSLVQQSHRLEHQNQPRSLQKPPLDQPSGVLGVQNQQKVVLGPQPNVTNRRLNPNLSHNPHTEGFIAYQQEGQSNIRPVQMNQVPFPQRQAGFTQNASQQKPSTSAALHQPQRIANAPRGFQTKGPSPFPSSATLQPRTPSELAKAESWYNHIQQKLQELKQKHGLLLVLLRTELHFLCFKAAHTEQLGHYKKSLMSVEIMIKILSAPRSWIEQCRIEKLKYHLDVIEKVLDRTHREKEEHAQSFHSPGGKSQISQLLQDRNLTLFHPGSLVQRATQDSSAPLSSMQPVVNNSEPDPCRSLQNSSRKALEDTNPPLQPARPMGLNVQHEANQAEFACNMIADTVESASNHQTMLPLPQNLRQHLQSQSTQQKKDQILVQNIQQPANAGLKPPGNQHQTFEHVLPKLTEHPSPGIENQHQKSEADVTIIEPEHASPENGTQTLISYLLEKGIPVEMPPSSSPRSPDPEKQISDPSPLLVPGERSQSEASSALTQLVNHQAPIERLVKAVQSITPEALIESVNEIASVISDLPELGCAVQESSTQYVTNASSGTLLSSATNTDSVKQSKRQIRDYDSTATSSIKRQRIETGTDLLDEIRVVNQQLMETMVGLDSTEETETSEGTIVKCTHRVAISGSFGSCASRPMFPALSLRLLIPPNYPKCSPIILDISKSNDSGDLSDTMKLRFSTALQNLPEPMSLGDMAKAWDVCAQAELSEYGVARRFGGSWENCTI